MQPVDAQAHAATEILRALFGDALLAVYLHGSAVSGGLRPRSDIDLLAILGRPMTGGERESLLAALLRLSGRHPAPPGGPRCLEVIVFLKADLAPPDFPARAEFLYGEWLRDAFEAGQRPMPLCDPENTLVLAQARRQALALFGPELLPDIPEAHIRRAMREALPSLLAGLHGEERNVLLTLARMWRTAATGAFVSKDAAADWAVPQMPAAEAATLAHARDAYLGRIDDAWDERQDAARRTGDWLHERVSALL